MNKTKATLFTWRAHKGPYCWSIVSGMLCTKQPVQVCQNVAFVVDLQSVYDPLDIRADENGVWHLKGSPVAYGSIHTSSGNTRMLKRSKMGNHSHHYKLTRTCYRHTSSPDFTRINTTVHCKYSMSNDSQLCVCMHVYIWYTLIYTFTDEGGCIVTETSEFSVKNLG